MSEKAILLATSMENTVAPLRSAARSIGRDIVWVETAAEASKQLKRLPVAVIVADERLPDMDGIEFLKAMQKAAPYAVRMLMLGPESSAERAVEALNQARVARFLQKPWAEPKEVRQLLGEGVSTFLLEEQEREAVENLQYIVQGKAGAANPRTLQIERLCTMGEMAGSLIHKFNNTLTIMMGHLDLLLDEVKGTKLARRLDMVSKAASDGVDLARTLQEFIRTDPSQRQTLSLNRVISETVRMTEPIWKSSERQRRGSIEIVSDFGSTPNIWGNLPEVREAITNLILNAVDAMPDGGALEIRTATTSGDVEVQVSDDGLGMSPEVKRRIFDPFFTTKGKKGNGLGLSIVRRIVEEHGGTITVDSTQGRGTTFTMRIPGADTPTQPIEAAFPDPPSLS